MRSVSRLSSYPILDNYNDCYVDSDFSVEYEITQRFSEVLGKLSFKLNNDEISKLISDKKAEYTAHIECPSTCYRKVITSYMPEIEFSIDEDLLADKLEIRTFIVLTEDVKGFSSTRFHPDYDGLTFDLSKHQILAIGAAKDCVISKDDKDLEDLPSVFTIVEYKGDKNINMSVDTDSVDRILIRLNSDAYKQYLRMGKTVYKATIFSLILLPALIVVIQRMHQYRDDPDMTSRHWFQVINDYIEENGYNLEQITVENESLLNICQDIFRKPIDRAFNELEDYSERMEG